MYVHSNLEDLTMNVLEAARRINELRIYGYFGIGNGWAEYLREHGTSRRESLDHIVRLVMHGTAGPVQEDSLQAWAEDLVRELSRLSAAYPFPQSASPSDDGGANIHTSRPLPIDFNAMKDVWPWLTEMESLSRQLTWLKRAHGRAFDTLLGVFSDAWQERHLHDLPEDLKHSLADANPVNRVAEFMKNVECGQEIAREVKRRVERLEAYERRIPTKVAVRTTIAIAALVFVAGVLVPLFAPGVDRAIYLWVPAVSYLCMFFRNTEKAAITLLG